MSNSRIRGIMKEINIVDFDLNRVSLFGLFSRVLGLVTEYRSEGRRGRIRFRHKYLADRLATES